MKTATVADLRNHFRQIASWIEHGETVEILKRGKPFAHLVSASAGPSAALEKPDFMAQLREVWGDRMFSAEEVTEMRAFELEGEQG